MDKTSLIYKVLSAEANESEKKELENWLSQSEENKIEFNDLKLLWEASKDPDQSITKNQLQDGFIKIKALMEAKLKKRQQNKRIWILITVLILGLLVFIFIFFRKEQNHDSFKRLKFSNTSLEQVIKILESEYEIDIELENKKVSACTFTGVIYRTKNVDDVLRTLDEALSINHRAVREGHYLLTGSGCLSVK